MIDKIPHDHSGQKHKHCRTCGEFKPPEQYHLYRHKGVYGGYQSQNSCIPCEKQRKAVSHLKNKYNLTWEDYCAMVKAQDNKCYLCGEHPTDIHNKLVVDHCHKGGGIRKLLCRMCNIHLTKIEACPEYLNRVVEYLQSSKS